MKPKRIAMAHELIVNYGLYKDLNVYVEIELFLKKLTNAHFFKETSLFNQRRNVYFS